MAESRPKLLVVVDDQQALDRYENAFEKNFTVIPVFFGNDVLSVARDENPDAVLIDLLLERRDGEHVENLLRNEPRFEGLPIARVAPVGGTAPAQSLTQIFSRPFRSEEIRDFLLAQTDTRDVEVIRVIQNYSLGSVGTMIAIPIPGADMAATYGLWAKMIIDIARIYGEEAAFADAKVLAADLFTGVILTTVAWFSSAKAATTVLKFIPGAGTVTAYLVDAAIAGFGAKKITAGVGFAAASYYKSGKTLQPKDILKEIKEVLRNPANGPVLLRELRKQISKRGK